MPIAFEGWCTKTNQDEQLGAVEKLSLILAAWALSSKALHGA